MLGYDWFISFFENPRCKRYLNNVHKKHNFVEHKESMYVRTIEKKIVKEESFE